MAQPVLYDPSIEHPEANEQEVDQQIIDTMHGISETTFNNSGVAIRSVHAKSHGLLHGTLEVLPVSGPLAQGLFGKPGSYPVVMRLSTTPGDILDDSVSTPRGVAIKVIGVEGERVAGSESDVTQDFVLVNGPAFNAPNAGAFLKNLKLLAATTDRLEPVKKLTSTVARGAEAVLEVFGKKSTTLATLGGQQETHILGETFYSQVPILYGANIVKIGLFPVSPELTALTDAPMDNTGHVNAIRNQVVDYFLRQGGTWEVRVQFCTNLTTMPVEDASVVWPEDDSPYVTVGRITAPKQDPWTIETIAAVDEGLSFSPWHALAAHRPLGSVMRARKRAYEMSAQFRAKYNNKPVVEPRSLDDLKIPATAETPNG